MNSRLWEEDCCPNPELDVLGALTSQHRWAWSGGYSFLKGRPGPSEGAAQDWGGRCTL